MRKDSIFIGVALVLLLPLFAKETVKYGRYSFSIDKNLPQPWVMVIGVTGAGKSSFIRKSIGDQDSPNLGKVCHGLEPCTQEVIISGWHYKNIELFLVDTPGFDDPHRTDEEILTEIAEEFAVLYRSGASIGAVIYLHRIDDDRLSRGSLRSISALREIVGTNKFPSLILVSTRWENTDQYKGPKKEAELKKGVYWGSMMKAGAKVMRHDGTVASAQKILDEAISRARKIPLKIQSEMVDQGLASEETSAMLAIESFDFFEKIQHALSKGEITQQEYMHQISSFILRKRRNGGSFWQQNAPMMKDILVVAAKTALYGLGSGVGGVPPVFLEYAIDAVSNYFGSRLNDNEPSPEPVFATPFHYEL